MDFNPQKYQLRAEKTFKSVNMKFLQYYLVIYVFGRWEVDLKLAFYLLNSYMLLHITVYFNLFSTWKKLQLKGKK